MSLLTMAQTIAEEVGVAAPSTVYGSSDRTAKQLFRLINRSGKQLAGRNWSILHREHTFSTVASTANYTLPSDFARLLNDTAWDRTQYWQLRGPVSPADWQILKSGLVATASLQSRWRIKATATTTPIPRDFYLDPTPSSVLSMVFEYVSSNWCTNSTGATGRTAFAADTDVALISEDLIELDCIWRMLDRKGFAYEESKAEAEQAIDQAFAEDQGATVINMAGGRYSISPSRANVPEGGFG